MKRKNENYIHKIFEDIGGGVEGGVMARLLRTKLNSLNFTIQCRLNTPH